MDHMRDDDFVNSLWYRVRSEWVEYHQREGDQENAYEIAEEEADQAAAKAAEKISRARAAGFTGSPYEAYWVWKAD